MVKCIQIIIGTSVYCCPLIEPNIIDHEKMSDNEKRFVSIELLKKPAVFVVTSCINEDGLYEYESQPMLNSVVFNGAIYSLNEDIQLDIPDEYPTDLKYATLNKIHLHGFKESKLSSHCELFDVVRITYKGKRLEFMYDREHGAIITDGLPENSQRLLEEVITKNIQMEYFVLDLKPTDGSVHYRFVHTINTVMVDSVQFTNRYDPLTSISM